MRSHHSIRSALYTARTYLLIIPLAILLALVAVGPGASITDAGAEPDHTPPGHAKQADDSGGEDSQASGNSDSGDSEAQISAQSKGKSNGKAKGHDKSRDRDEGGDDDSGTASTSSAGNGSSNGKARGHAKKDNDGDADNKSKVTTENNDDDGVKNHVVDNDDNRHPSGKDRSVEHGKSKNNPNQGKSESDPDGNKNGGKDKPGGRGGVDKHDQDGNNGCGNDDDFEDDNNGNCGGKKQDKSPPGDDDDDDDDDDDPPGPDRTNFCHATGSSTNPFVFLENIPAHSGHSKHADDLQGDDLTAADCPGPDDDDDDPPGPDRTNFCHATGSSTNPFVFLENIPAHSGHSKHADDLQGDDLTAADCPSGDEDDEPEDEFVFVCHQRGANGYTFKRINQNALNGHLRHGDFRADSASDCETDVDDNPPDDNPPDDNPPPDSPVCEGPLTVRVVNEAGGSVSDNGFIATINGDGFALDADGVTSVDSYLCETAITGELTRTPRAWDIVDGTASTTMDDNGETLIFVVGASDVSDNPIECEGALLVEVVNQDGEFVPDVTVAIDGSLLTLPGGSTTLGEILCGETIVTLTDWPADVTPVGATTQRPEVRDNETAEAIFVVDDTRVLPEGPTDRSPGPDVSDSDGISNGPVVLGTRTERGPGGPLARTGTNSATTAWLAVMTILAGGVLVRVSRKRKAGSEQA